MLLLDVEYLRNGIEVRDTVTMECYILTSALLNGVNSNDLE